MAKESMSEQTIRYWCSELTKEGILERDREHNAYSISDKAAEEIRYFAGIFGTEALHHLTANFPISTTAEKSISEFVSRFGALVVYAFIEAMRPFEDATSMTVDAKDKTILSWVRNAIPIEEMFNQFLAVFVSDIKKKQQDDGSESLYEFDREKVNELSQALEKAYPDLYESLQKARTYSLDRPKKQSTTTTTLSIDRLRLKEVFCRYLCERFHSSDTRTFVAHKLFSESKMRDYMSNEPALKPYMSGGDNFYRLVDGICTDLVMDRILEFTENPDNGDREYHATTNLLKICHILQE